MLNPSNRPSLGSDPEAFFEREGQIVGSERAIPAKGISTPFGKIVRDGVQFELNPRSSQQINELAENIGALLRLAEDRAQAKGLRLNFNGLVEVTREELDSLSKKCRILGCMPSFNLYEERPINVDPVLYRKRSSGGHVHIGIYNRDLLDDRRRLVPAMDTLVGMLCVLLDRDPGAAERRENYGRAGEFRLPDYGLEYRTTSNFWLRDYSLMTFVFGMTALVYELGCQSVSGNEALWKEFASKVDIKGVIKAIDTNDFKLAMKNFKRIVPFLKANLPEQGYPLAPNTIDQFIGLAESIEKRGIESHFPTASITARWQNLNGKLDFATLLRLL